MATTDSPGDRLFTVFYAGLLTLALDQVSKWLAVRSLVEGQPVNLGGDILRLTLVYNPGLAFGLPLPGGVYFSLLGIFLLLALAAVFIRGKKSYRFTFSKYYLLVAGLGLGGAIGNLIDRARLGQVVDFIDLGLSPALRWPAFNIADLGLTLAALLLAYHWLRIGRGAPDL